ncbi:MAG: shikimate kinase [Eubacteriales bacterium]|nr:shikimate kinase [Eubacteriales bacterium]
MQYGLIGEKLGHSYSCEIHEAIADYRYELMQLRPDELEEFLKKKEFRGINVTIPYKQAVIPYLDEISETAEHIGAVNTIVNRDGKLYGDNTDFTGMRELVTHAGIEVCGRKVLILGTGGTSKTALALMNSLGAREVFRVSRKNAPGMITYAQAKEKHCDAQILVNTTPVGMFPNEEQTPIELSSFPALEGVIDVVYNPLRTNLVLDAAARGIPAEGGLYMLAAQGVHASSVFLGRETDTALFDRAWHAVKRGKQNIVLIGMPTSGKTTVGKLLAGRLNMPFYDTDELLAEKFGCHVSAYISENGETAFREEETRMVAETAKRGGCVIATGGGAVLRAENVRALKRSGVLVFLDRALENLSAAQDRPLSADSDKLKKMFVERAPIYRAAADIAVKADDLPEAVADTVMKELEK